VKIDLPPGPAPATESLPASELESGPKLSAKARQTSPAVAKQESGAELTNLPRPSIARQNAPVLVAEGPKHVHPAPPTAATFEKLPTRPEPVKNDRAVTPVKSSDADRYSTPTVPYASLPRAAVASDAAAPLPEQISTFDVPETRKGTPAQKSPATPAPSDRTQSAPPQPAQPKFGASKY
jgi:hypothetical protein